MKKFFLLFFIFCFIPMSVSAVEIKNAVLKEGCVYLLILDSAAKSFKTSNPNVLSIEVVGTLENDKEQVILKTVSEGFTNLSIETEGGVEEYKFTVSNQSKIDSCDDLFEIEKPDFGGDKK